MAYTLEQCRKEFKDASQKLVSLFGTEKLREADDVFDINAILSNFLKKHSSRKLSSGELGLTIEIFLEDFTYTFKSKQLINLICVLRSMLHCAIGIYYRIVECEEFRNEVINQLWKYPVPTTYPAVMMCRAMIVAYDLARASLLTIPLPSSDELISRQKTRDFLSKQDNASIGSIDPGFVCIVPGRKV